MPPPGTVTEISIPTWANGPDGSANGGYAAGLLAGATGWSGAVEVSLRLPPPLGVPLVVEAGDDVVECRKRDAAEDLLVATARRSDLTTLERPDGVTAIAWEAAQAAERGFPYAAHHPFPRCLCCGTERDPATPSLGIHCGPLEGSSLFAATWTPSVDLADAQDPSVASLAACWSALDCPSATPFADPARPAVLARFEVDLEARARIGAPHVVVAWELMRDGRKLHSASTLLDDGGRVLGRARALWIEVRAT